MAKKTNGKTAKPEHKKVTGENSNVEFNDPNLAMREFYKEKEKRERKIYLVERLDRAKSYYMTGNHTPAANLRVIAHCQP